MKWHMIMVMQVLLCIVCALVCSASGYQIGVGRADCTGPPVEVVFMGYAHFSQRGKGLHLRQYSRAFIIDDNVKRAVFISVDGAMVAHTIKRDVLEKLHQKYNDVYTIDNLIISGTHTHGTPGGFMMDLLYDMSTFGFVSETYRALVNGIFNSIVVAHESMQEGKIYIGETEILDASINRSPSSYLNNPPEERAQYSYDTDKMMTQLSFVDNTNKLIGALNWFAVHPTSMNNSNCLITTDNVGYASILLEKQMNPDHLPGRGRFVGGFASTNLGDVSPNIMGPKCEFTGLPCDVLTSSCPPKHGQCIASGPGKNQFESTKIIATRLFKGAMKILLNPTRREVTGPIRFAHQYIDMPSAKGSYFNPKTRKMESVKGCLPAMGYSFAAGTTDGPGAFDFTQATTSDNPLWNIVRDFLGAPTPEDINCQSPKPILLSTGRTTFPYEWQPKIVTTQLVQIGNIVLAAVPGEFTTMSGRRLRNSVRAAMMEAGGSDVQVIVAGLSNMYSSYVATPEEYIVQRYEGASTIFGPHTLTLYIEQFQRLATAIVRNEALSPGPNPPYLDGKIMSLQTKVYMDTAPGRSNFGDVIREPKPEYTIGDTVSVLFVSGNPRNDLQHERSYFTVEQMNADGNWVVVAADSDWETWFEWKSTSLFLGQSTFEVFWEIGKNVGTGTYRIRHAGASKRLWSSRTEPYIGTSSTFAVTNNSM